MARTIQQKSNRHDKPFIAVDCGTLSRELAGSELFGHVKGSFTGALTDKEGIFETANGGTLFLDEVANLPLDVQATLLRVIPVSYTHLDVYKRQFQNPYLVQAGYQPMYQVQRLLRSPGECFCCS